MLGQSNYITKVAGTSGVGASYLWDHHSDQLSFLVRRTVSCAGAQFAAKWHHPQFGGRRMRFSIHFWGLFPDNFHRLKIEFHLGRAVGDSPSLALL